MSQSWSGGGRAFGYRNPLSQSYHLAGTVKGSQLAVTQESVTIGVDFTTTDTSSTLVVAQVNVHVPRRESAIYAFVNAVAHHSAANAEVTASLVLVNSDGAGFTIASVSNISLGAANSRHPLPVNTGLDLASTLSALRVPDDMTLSFRVRNHTAGTLTVVSGSAEFRLHAFVTGDSSL